MTKDQLRHFAEVVRTGRAKLDLNKLEFCAQAGITPNTLRALERGVQHPSPDTIEKLARLLGKTPAALTGGLPPIDRSDPLLERLNDEDLEVAQAFHHAPMVVKTRVLGVLQEMAPRRTARTGAAAEWVERFLKLAPERRAAVAAVITELESLPPTGAEARSAEDGPERGRRAR